LSIPQHAIELALEEYVSRTSKACSVMARSISPEEPKKAVFEDEELTNINKEGVNAANRMFYTEAVRVSCTTLFLLVLLQDFGALLCIVRIPRNLRRLKTSCGPV
jgi:hypothetical protein